MRIHSKLAEPACIFACGVVMFTCHSVLKVDRKVDRQGYEECKWESAEVQVPGVNYSGLWRIWKRVKGEPKNGL